MNNNKSLITLLSLTMILSGCNNQKDSNSEVEESSSSEKENKEYVEQGTYKLEENETYKPFKIIKDELKNLPSSYIINSSLADVLVDPFTSSYFDDEATIRYPGESLLEGKTVLYTSAWYLQKTHKRNDNVKEYILEREEDIWFVSKINNSSETFIPFNSIVLSIPDSKNVTYNVDDIVDINYNIPVYDIGFYNQDGYRIAVEYANRHYFSNNGISLIDSNTMSKVTNTAWQKISTINFLYNKESGSYVVDKFRIHDDKGRIFSNVNDGFLLGAILSDANANVAMFEGVRFNLGDTINVEDNANIHNKSFSFSSSTTNQYIFSDGTSCSFNLVKSENDYTTNAWGYEIAVDKSNRIIANDSHIKEISDGGYKLVLTTAGSTKAEELSYLLDEVFLNGSKVNVSGSTISINCATNVRASNYYTQVALRYENIMDDIAYYNYAYNMNELNLIGKELDNIDKEMNELSSSNDPTKQYRYYSLMGSLYQLQNRLVGATTRNEAVQVKGNWYIIDFNNYDKDLESIIKHLNIIKNAGFNELIVNALDSNGRSYYENSDCFTLCPTLNSKTYGEYGKNYLKAITEEAHKLGLYVYANLTPFTNGLENAFTELADCRALSINGATSVVSSQGKVSMLDPGNELVQQRIKDTVDDILEKNENIDGIAIDYIRYGADNSSISCIMGITEAERAGFNSYCNNKGLSYNYSTLDALKNALKTNPTVLSTFNEFQQTLITDTVKNIKDVCLEYKVPLVAAVADNYTFVKTWKCQDWAAWAKNGYVDTLYLMAYYLGEYYTSYYFNDMLKNTKNSCLLVDGIDPSYAAIISEYYATITHGATSNINSMGYATFGSHTNDAQKGSWDLHSICNWVDSISPYDTLEKTMKASGDLLLQRCDDIYITYNNMSNEQKAVLEADLNSLYQSISLDTVSSCNGVIEKLTAMKEKQYANGEANNRIVEQLDAMYRIALQKLNVLGG